MKEKVNFIFLVGLDNSDCCYNLTVWVTNRANVYFSQLRRNSGCQQEQAVVRAHSPADSLLLLSPYPRWRGRELWSLLPLWIPPEPHLLMTLLEGLGFSVVTFTWGICLYCHVLQAPQAKGTAPPKPDLLNPWIFWGYLQEHGWGANHAFVLVWHMTSLM